MVQRDKQTLRQTGPLRLTVKNALQRSKHKHKHKHKHHLWNRKLHGNGKIQSTQRVSPTCICYAFSASLSLRSDKGHSISGFHFLFFSFFLSFFPSSFLLPSILSFYLTSFCLAFFSSLILPLSVSPVSEVRALCHHVASEPGHLSFCKGDVMQVLSRADSDWLVCSLGETRGLVPIIYVTLRDESQSQGPQLTH